MYLYVALLRNLLLPYRHRHLHSNTKMCAWLHCLFLCESWCQHVRETKNIEQIPSLSPSIANTLVQSFIFLKKPYVNMMSENYIKCGMCKIKFLEINRTKSRLLRRNDEECSFDKLKRLMRFYICINLRHSFPRKRTYAAHIISV